MILEVICQFTSDISFCLFVPCSFRLNFTAFWGVSLARSAIVKFEKAWSFLTLTCCQTKFIRHMRVLKLAVFTVNQHQLRIDSSYPSGHEFVSLHASIQLYVLLCMANMYDFFTVAYTMHRTMKGFV